MFVVHIHLVLLVVLLTHLQTKIEICKEGIETHILAKRGLKPYKLESPGTGRGVF